MTPRYYSTFGITNSSGLDQQANATMNLGCTGEGVKNVANVFLDGLKLNEAVSETEYENLFIVPSGSSFINGEQRLIGDVMKGSVERRLKIAMKDLDFDYVIIDCLCAAAHKQSNAQ